MELTEHTNEDLTIISVDGRLDASTAHELEDLCKATIAGGSTKLVLDLTLVEYLSSAGLRVILATAKRLKAVRGDIVLCGLSGTVAKVFTISGFSAFMPVADDVKAAIGVL